MSAARAPTAVSPSTGARYAPSQEPCSPQRLRPIRTGTRIVTLLAAAYDAVPRWCPSQATAAKLAELKATPFRMTGRMRHEDDVIR